jgi:3-oxoadipate enol-lactonase
MPTVTANGVETYYEEYGEGPPIVFLHGAVSDHRLWAEQMQPLTDEYTVIAYDCRGHGRTDGSEHDAYTIDLYADDLAAFIDAVDLDRPTICGLSMGGMIGYTYAAKYPEQLSALVTLGAPTPQLFSVTERIQRTVLPRIVNPIMENERIMGGVFWLMEKLYGEGSTGDPDKAEQIQAAHHCDVPDMDRPERTKMMRGVLQYTNTPLDYDSISVPVLAMHGENEPFVETHANYVRERLSDCATREIPDASHNSHVDNPEFITDTLREFLPSSVEQSTVQTSE